ncbi:hypothetical protein BH23PLA1_BH23PLA1_27920 [soil metagenome]
MKFPVFNRYPLVIILTLCLAATASADEVVLIPGSTLREPGNRIRGQIQSETPEEIRIDNKTVPLDQVAEVNYEPANLSFTQARLQENNGNFENSAELYQKAAAESSARPTLAQAARFGRARALAKAAMIDPEKRAGALKELEGFVNENANSRHYGPALELIVRLSFQGQDYDRAARALENLGKLSWARDRSDVFKARVQARQGQHKEALAALDRIIGSAAEGSTQRRDAMLARAEAQAGLKDFEAAEQSARAVIEAADPEDAVTLAPAYNTLGDTLRAAGKPRDALFAYLKTDILYSSEPDEHARSLAGITQLWRMLDRNDRAAEALERLRQRYPQSPHIATATSGGSGQ